MEEHKPADEPARQEQRRSAVWAFAKVAGPVVVSIVSLAISVLTYQDTHNADVQGALAAQQVYASKVSYWIAGSGAKARFVIQNLSPGPVTDVVVAARSHYTNTDDSENLVAFLSIGTVPPCSVMTTDVLQAAHTNLIRSPFSDYVSDGHLVHVPEILMTGPIAPVAINDIEFTDAKGLTWTRDNRGVLEPGSFSNVISLLYPPQYLSNPVDGGSVSAANGCS